MSAFRAAWLDAGMPDMRAAWAHLVATSPHRTPFAALPFGEALSGVLSQSHGIRLRVAGVHDRAGTLVGGALIYERRRGPYRLAVVPPLGLYTPIVLAAPLVESDVHQRASPLDALLALLDRTFHAQALHLHPAMTDVRPFSWAGYEARPRYTYWQPLADPDTLLRAGSRSVRRRIRKVSPTYTFDLADVQVDQVIDTLNVHLARRFETKRASFPLGPEAVFSLLAPLFQAGIVQIASVRPVQGDAPPEAVSVVLNDGRVAHKWFSASVLGPAMTVLNHALRTRLYDDGVEAVDYTGANLPRVAEFKRGFGATLTPYYRVERYRRPELRALALARPFL